MGRRYDRHLMIPGRRCRNLPQIGCAERFTCYIDPSKRLPAFVGSE